MFISIQIYTYIGFPLWEQERVLYCIISCRFVAPFHDLSTLAEKNRATRNNQPHFPPCLTKRRARFLARSRNLHTSLESGPRVNSNALMRCWRARLSIQLRVIIDTARILLCIFDVSIIYNRRSRLCNNKFNTRAVFFFPRRTRCYVKEATILEVR